MKSIVIQLDLLDTPRAFLQDSIDNSCTKIEYAELTAAEKATWDAFQALLEAKVPVPAE